MTRASKIVFAHTGCHKEGIKRKHKCYYPNNTGSHWEDEEDVKQKHTWHWKETSKWKNKIKTQWIAQGPGQSPVTDFHHETITKQHPAWSQSHSQSTDYITDSSLIYKAKNIFSDCPSIKNGCDSSQSPSQSLSTLH